MATANFRIPAKEFYDVADSIGGNYDGMYAVLVAGWDIEIYSRHYKYQVRHVLSRIEKFRNYLERS